MKTSIVLSLCLCGSLVSAEYENFFVEPNRMDIFGPLNENVYPILFKGIDAYYDDLLNKTSQLDYTDKKRVLFEFNHSYGKKNIPAIQFKEDFRMPEVFNVYKKKVFKKFYTEIKKDINALSDRPILLNRAIEYNEKIHNLTDFSPKSYNKYEYIKFRDTAFRLLGWSEFEGFYSQMDTSKFDAQLLLLILRDNVCDRRMSVQQMLGNFHGHLTLSRLQVLLTQWFAEEMIAFAEGESTINLTKNSLINFGFGFGGQLLKLLKNRMASAPREVWRCDPADHIHDVTYTKLGKPFQDFSKEEKAANCDISYQPICHKLNDISDRYFNLQPVFSNVYNNSVITGIRLVKKNHIVHIQIQEGQLLPNGMINASSIIWAPIEDYVSCLSCYVLKWDGSRSIDLDDVTVSDPNSVLTGISFDKVKKNDTQETLRLVVYSTPFNFTTGKLAISDHDLPWNIQYPKPKEIQNYYHKGEDGFFSSLYISFSDQLFSYLLSPGNLDQLTFNKAISRTGEEFVFPYIDIQPVTTIPPSPMSGAGLFYKNSTNGFLAMKLFTYDMTSFIN